MVTEGITSQVVEKKVAGGGEVEKEVKKIFSINLKENNNEEI